MNIPMPNEVQPVSFLEYANQFANFDSRKQQQRLMDMKMQQMPQEQARRDRLADANIDSMETEGMADKHKLAIQISSGIYNAMQQSGLQENDPAFQQQLEQVSRPLRPILSKVFGVQDDPTKPTDWNGIKSIAMAGQQQEKDDYLLYYDQQGTPNRFSKRKGVGGPVPLEGGGFAQGSKYTPAYNAAWTNAGKGQGDREITNPDGTKSVTTNQMLNPDAFPIQPSNNPGNIRPVGESQGFQQFGSAEDGIAAIDKNLQAYGAKHGINTLAGVISRWSPPNENNTQALIAKAAKRLGISPDQPIDLSDPVQRHAISSVIMLQENQIFKKQPPSYGPTAEEKTAQELEEYRKKKEIDAQTPKPLNDAQQYALDEKKDKAQAAKEDAIFSIKESIKGIDRLAEIQKKTTTGPLTSNPVSATIRKAGSELGLDSVTGGKNLARLEKGYAEEAVKAIGAFKSIGVTFGALSNAEGNWVKETQAKIDSDGEVNLEMLAKGKALLQNKLDMLEKRNATSGPDYSNMPLEELIKHAKEAK